MPFDGWDESAPLLIWNAEPLSVVVRSMRRMPASRKPEPPRGVARRRLLRLRRFLAALTDDRFDMSIWRTGRRARRLGLFGRLVFEPECACIGGWAGHLFGVPAPLAGVWLGLTEAEQGALFAPHQYDQRGRYTRAMAVAVLDGIIATGAVRWGGAQ